MSATKILGYGTLVKCDPAGGSSYTAQGAIQATTPSERSRKAADATTLDDTREQMDPGIIEATPFEFSQIWKPGDTNHAVMDTLFGSKAVATWQIVYPQATPITEAFSGWVMKIGPEQIVNSEYVKRKVTVMVTTTPTLS